MSNLTIVVAGATGQQGGSVVDALQGSGDTIVGLTRDAASVRSKALQSKGVQVRSADFQNLGDLTTAFRGAGKGAGKGADALFLMSTPFEAGVDAEVSQGINAIDAAKSAGVKHIVFSSVSDADQNTGIPHFDSKYKIEKHLAQSGVPFTIVAPVFFADNMLAPFVLPGLQNGSLAQAMPVDRKLQSVSLKNIGEFAALVLTNRDRFLGKRINIAGDELSGGEYAQAISAASGKSIDYFEVPIDQVRQNSEDMALMYTWFKEEGYSADIPGLRRDYPEVNWESFQDWAARQDWSVLNKTN